MTRLPDEFTRLLVDLGLTDGREPPVGEPLAGGVSSEIWRVELVDRHVCVKRALPQLRVSADWRAPVSRTLSERAWLETAAAIVPGCAPAVLGGDDTAFVMEWVDPRSHPLWKTQLLDGRGDVDTARAVAATLADIHARTAGDATVASAFATDATFAALRLDPYFSATVTVHPDLARRLGEVRDRTAGTRCALVHGDVSPKNLLVGTPPVFLDAECAWYGDPAFDAAFCATHLLLKAAHLPAKRHEMAVCAFALVDRWRAGVDWEPATDAESRVATLVPALLLARVDGKSPVEYLSEGTRELVRRAARRLVSDQPQTVEELVTRWTAAMSGG